MVVVYVSKLRVYRRMSFVASKPSISLLRISAFRTLPFTANQPIPHEIPTICKRRRISMRDRSKNRKPLQKGRNLSIEAIQTVQALKRAAKKDYQCLEQVFDLKFKRLLKFDMMAVLRELLRQNECFLALKVYEDVRKELWYKPQVALYADIITVLASNGLFEQVEHVYMYLKAESSLKPEIEGFNALLRTLISFNIIGLVRDCYSLMKSVGCDPDRSSFRILINGLESKGEMDLSASIRQDARKFYGESLEFLEEEEEMMPLRYN